MANPDSAPRRTAVSHFAPYAPRQQRVTSSRNGSCTHHTMTRLHSRESRCPLCNRPSTTGWLWRCMQDKELLLENEMEWGVEVKLDAFSNGFPRPTSPSKRSPAARASKLSFLEEISDVELKMYSKMQLGLILSQRAHVVELAQASEAALRFEEAQYAGLSFTPSDMPSNPYAKPWISSNECQFKCCQNCRPHSVERGYLSINGIVNDDIPASAITGFGFHFLKSRPVSLAKHVKNLGLRPSPRTSTKSILFLSPKQSQQVSKYQGSSTLRARPAQGVGLGLVNTASASPLLDSDVPESSTTSISPSFSSTGSTAQGQTFEIFLCNHSHASSSRTFDFDEKLAVQTPLPEQSPEELALISPPLTPMEKSELGGSFGSAPLAVPNGVAVKEEGVGFHVPDLITQF